MKIALSFILLSGVAWGQATYTPNSDGTVSMTKPVVQTPLAPVVKLTLKQQQDKIAKLQSLIARLQAELAALQTAAKTAAAGTATAQ